MQWENDSLSLDGSRTYHNGQASPRLDTVATCSRPPRPRLDATRDVPSSIADQDDDAQLIRRIAARDRDAFECLYYRYSPRLISFLTRYLGPSCLREEVINEVMIVIWQRAADFRPTSRPSTWIFGIARHKAFEAHTCAVKAQAKPESVLPPWTEEENLEEIALQEERIYIVGKALNHLPPDQRTTLTLAFYHNCSQREIAARTGYPISTIKSQMRQGLRRMRVALARVQASESLPCRLTSSTDEPLAIDCLNLQARRDVSKITKCSHRLPFIQSQVITHPSPEQDRQQEALPCD